MLVLMGTPKNVGRLDSAVRVLLGLWLMAHGLGVTARPYLTIAWGAVGLLVLGTGLLRICPVYALFGAFGPHAASRRP